MRGIITLLLVIWQIAQPPTKLPTQPYQFQPSHLQYIQDSIQPPIPQIPITIYVEWRLLHPRTVGLAWPINEHTYLIELNPLWPELHYQTMHHELVHIKQFVRQDLEYNPITKQARWLGQPIDWDTPYHIRPWEVQADLQASEYIKWYQTTH